MKNFHMYGEVDEGVEDDDVGDGKISTSYSLSRLRSEYKLSMVVVKRRYRSY